MERIKRLLGLFLTMFKIGLFTFGGGYAMIALLENEFVEKKKLLKEEIALLEDIVDNDEKIDDVIIDQLKEAIESLVTINQSGFSNLCPLDIRPYHCLRVAPAWLQPTSFPYQPSFE